LSGERNSIPTMPAAQNRRTLVWVRKEPSGIQQGSGGGGTGLHAEQHYEYHRQPKPGDILTATSRSGQTWERQGRRSGKLIFSESITEYRDQHGELVVTARGVGVRTERPVEQS
jgi:hypothetical protein